MEDEIRKRRQSHGHQHQHRRLHGHGSLGDIIRRQLGVVESVVTEVIQTVSVVQLVDAAGSTLGVEPLTEAVDQIEASSAPIPTDAAAVDSQVASAASAYNIGTSLPLSNALAPTSAIATSLPPATSLISDSAPYSIAPPSTSAPSSTAPPFPSLPAIYNSTSQAPFLSSNSSFIRSLFANITTSSTGDASTVTSLESSNPSDVSSIWSSFASGDGASLTDAGGSNGNGGATAAGFPPAASTTISGAPPTASPGPPTTTVIGGVVGGVAGIAVVVFVALFLLKWKRRHSSGLRLLRERSDSVGNSGGNGSFPSAPSGGEVSVAERLLPFAVPAALASLTGHPKPPATPPSTSSDSPARSFYRVSGKKLTSVLQSGGDGYSDPRNSPPNNSREVPRSNPHDSMQSSSSYYRDSGGWYGGPDAPRLQLGSPMRPDSGVPMIRAGPGRTPVTEQGPLHVARQLTPTRPVADPINRSQVSQDGSGNPTSRFTEEM